MSSQATSRVARNRLGARSRAQAASGLTGSQRVSEQSPKRTPRLDPSRDAGKRGSGPDGRLSNLAVQILDHHVAGSQLGHRRRGPTRRPIVRAALDGVERNGGARTGNEGRSHDMG